MRDVLVFIEQKHGKIEPVGLELLSEARRLVSNDVRIKALCLTKDYTDADINKLTYAGADEIIIIKDDRFYDYDTTYYSQAIIDLIANDRPDVFLVGSTLNGRDLAPRVSAKLNTGLTADATILAFEEHEKLLLLATRPALGGNLFATIICDNTIPQMATIRPSVFPVFLNKSRVSNVIVKTFDDPVQSSVEILERTPLVQKKVNLNKADIVIAGGRGVSNMFPVLKEIANIVGGEVAASRAVIDANIEQKDRLVGQTGATIHPKVYLACGISGAIQHISGMDKSELIIAINTDPNALIFDVSDVSIIADAKKVLPLLKDMLQAMQN